jgi:hypothetical protein
VPAVAKGMLSMRAYPAQQGSNVDVAQSGSNNWSISVMGMLLQLLIR